MAREVSSRRLSKSQSHYNTKKISVAANAQKGIFKTDAESLVIYVLGTVCLVLVVLAFLGFKLRSERNYLTDEERNDLMLRKEKKRENIIKTKMKKLEMKLRSSKVRKKIIETTQETEKLIQDKKVEWDEKGKAVYGDQWDGGENGNVPMRDLFDLPADELREVKIEAYNRVSKLNKEREETERAERASGIFYENEAVSQAVSNFKNNRGAVQSYNNGSDYSSYTDANLFGRSKRSHRPSETAPYHDPRFVTRGSTKRSGDAVFAVGQDPQPTPSPVRTRRQEVRNLETRQLVSSSEFTASENIPPPAIERQAPGLKNPRPPAGPPPARRKNKL